MWSGLAQGPLLVESSKRHPNQMSRSPRLVPLNMKEQWFLQLSEVLNLTLRVTLDLTLGLVISFLQMLCKAHDHREEQSFKASALLHLNSPIQISHHCQSTYQSWSTIPLIWFTKHVSPHLGTSHILILLWFCGTAMWSVFHILQFRIHYISVCPKAMLINSN